MEAKKELPVAAQAKFYELKCKYAFYFQNSQRRCISDRDLLRVQRLCQDLGNAIEKLAKSDDKYYCGLSLKLNQLVCDCQKKNLDLERFWGLIGDMGVLSYKLGIDAVPFLEKIKEIIEIIWNALSQGEDLTCGARLPVYWI